MSIAPRIALAAALLFGAWYMVKRRNNVGAGGALAAGAILLLLTTLIPAFSTTSPKAMGSSCTSTDDCDGTGVFCVATLGDPTKGTCQSVGPDSIPCVEEGTMCRANPAVSDDVTNNAGTCFSAGCGRSVDVTYTVTVSTAYVRHHKVRVMWPNGINVVNGLCISTIEQSNKLDQGVHGNTELVKSGLMAPYASWAPVVVTNLVGPVRFINNGRVMQVDFGDNIWSVIQPSGGVSNGGSLLIRPVELGGLMAPPMGKQWSDVCQRYVYDWSTATLLSDKKGVSDHIVCKTLDPALASIGCLAVFEFMGFFVGDNGVGDNLRALLHEKREEDGPFDPKAMAPFINPVRIGTGVCADDATQKCYYNFATDTATLSMLRACGKHGCGWNRPSGSLDRVARMYARPSNCHTPHCPVPVHEA